MYVKEIRQITLEFPDECLLAEQLKNSSKWVAVSEGILCATFQKTVYEMKCKTNKETQTNG